MKNFIYIKKQKNYVFELIFLLYELVIMLKTTTMVMYFW